MSEWAGASPEDQRARASEAALTVTEIGTYFGGGRARFVWVEADTWLIEAAQSAPFAEDPEPREPIDLWQVLAEALRSRGIRVVSRELVSAGATVRRHFLGASALTTFALADANDELAQSVMNWANLCATDACVRGAHAALDRRSNSGELSVERYRSGLVWLETHGLMDGLHANARLRGLDPALSRIEVIPVTSSGSSLVVPTESHAAPIRPTDQVLLGVIRESQPPGAELITADPEQKRAADALGVRAWHINSPYPVG